MRALSLILLAFLIGCGKQEIIVVSNPKNTSPELPDVTGKKMSEVKIHTPETKDEFDSIDWTFTRKFTEDDIKLAQLSVKFIENITGLTYNCQYHHFYWSDDMLKSLGTNRSLLGMTVFYQYRAAGRAYIGIASEMKPESIHDLNRVRDFGSLCSHEEQHRRNLDIEEIVRAKIEKPVEMNFDFYCTVAVSNFYVFNLDRFTNKPYSMMIEKVAYETGIQAPWHYNRDYIGEQIRPVIQILMVSPPTNGIPR